MRVVLRPIFSTEIFVDDDEIADFKWFIDDNRQAGKKIAENILDRQGNGDSADTQSGNQCSDIDPQVVEGQQQHD